LSGKSRGTGTNEHRIIHIDRCTFGVKYKSEHWHGHLLRVLACMGSES